MPALPALARPEAGVDAEVHRTPADLLAAMAGAQGAEVLPLPEVQAGTLRDEVLAFYALAGAVPTATGLAQLEAGLQGVPAPLQASVARILAAMNEATRLRNEAFATMTVEEALWAYRAGTASSPFTPEESEKAAAIVEKIDKARMNLAGRVVLAAIEAEMPILEANAATLAAPFVDPLGAIEIATVSDDSHPVDRTLLVDLGGNDDWSNNGGSAMPDFIIAAFPGCITTGGLDCTPLNGNRNRDSTGAVFGRSCSFFADRAAFSAHQTGEAAVDHAEHQQNARSVPDARNFATGLPGRAQGAANEFALDDGCLPQDANDVQPWADAFLTRGHLRQGDEHLVAVGIDVAGDDRFAPPREFNDINNGNNAAGCDTRLLGEAGKVWSRNITAGGAFAGVGILWDQDGNDFYGGRSIAVGAGHVGGVGVVVDRGQGDDEFSAIRLSIATGFFASAGLVYNDGAGNDRYALENDAPFFNEFEHFVGCDVSVRDGQGRANFDSVGVLYDRAGDDVYFVQDHDDSIPGAVREDPTTTQGSASSRLRIIGPPFHEVWNRGVGALIDEGGEDTYSRPGRADGVQSFEIDGWFLDHERA